MVSACHSWRWLGLALLVLVFAAETVRAGGRSPVHVDLYPDREVWVPAPGTSWQWQLTERVDTSIEADVYDVDLFDTPESTVAKLKSEGRVVIAYFSAGSFEPWRPDADRFPDDVKGRPLKGFADEQWLDVRSPEVRAILEDRLDLAVAKGFDAVEPDNVDGHVNETGFSLSHEDTRDFLYFLANAAHERGLSVGLKNALGLIEEVEPLFDWALNEQCLERDECGAMTPFLEAGKAVFHVEYVRNCSQFARASSRICGDRSTRGFSTLLKTLSLPSCRWACDFYPRPTARKARSAPFRIRRLR